jgi:hypothetical protein
MNEDCAQRYLIKNPDAMPLLWGLPAAIILLTGCCVGGVVLYFVPEWVWGRYRRAQAGTHEC